MITGVFRASIAGDDFVKYVREKDAETGVERLLEPFELLNPDNVEVGDENAYKVTLLTHDVSIPRVTDRSS